MNTPVRIPANHTVVKLLVADDAVIDDWDLRRVGRAKVKDAASGSSGRRIVLTGQVARGEFRVHRNGGFPTSTA